MCLFELGMTQPDRGQGHAVRAPIVEFSGGILALCKTMALKDYLEGYKSRWLRESHGKFWETSDLPLSPSQKMAKDYLGTEEQEA